MLDTIEGKVYFYRDREADEIITYCYYCAKQYGNQLIKIDLAGAWDICSNCEKQNIPSGETIVLIHNSNSWGG